MRTEPVLCPCCETVIGLVLLLAAVGAYAVGRGTSAFAVTEIAVEGPPAHVANKVTGALAGMRGDSLLALPHLSL